jgi:hypothetical protein
MKLTNSQLRKIIKEEFQRERMSIILDEEKKRIDILHEGMEKDELLLEFGMVDVGHFALDIGGLFPGVGEAADLANAALYAARGEFLMAALSVISMIPVVGDIVGKGGKLSILLGKGGGGKAAVWVAKLISKHMPKITKGIKGLAANPKVGKFVEPMLSAVKDFTNKALANPKSKEVLQSLQKVASTKAVVPVKGGKLAKLKTIAKKAQQKTAARQNLERSAQTLQQPAEGTA